MKSVGLPSLIKGKAEIHITKPSLVKAKAEIGSKTHITEPTLPRSLVIFLYAAKYRQQKLEGEVAPSGLLGTEPLQRNLAVNIKVGSKSSNSALKQREASHEKEPPLFLLCSC